MNGKAKQIIRKQIEMLKLLFLTVYVGDLKDEMSINVLFVL